MLILNLITHSSIHLFMSFSCKSQIGFHFQKWSQEKTYLIKSFFSLLTFNPMVPTGVFKEFFLKVNHRDVLSFITARKRSCGKVMFLHLSVILFRVSLSRGVSVRGCLSRGRRGLCWGGGFSVQGSLCLGVSVQGVVSVRGVVFVQGVSVWEGLCPGGLCSGVREVSIGVGVVLCPRESLLSGGSLSTGWSLSRGSLCGRVSVQVVSVQEVFLSGGLCQGDPPLR